MEKNRHSSKKLGEILVEAGFLSNEQLERGIKEHKKAGKRLGETLISMGFISEADVANALSLQLGIPYTNIATTAVEPEAIELIPERLAEKLRILPISVDRKVLHVAMADPLNLDAISELRFASDRHVKPTVSTLKEIKNGVRRYYHLAEPLQEILETMSIGHIELVAENMETAQDVDEAVKKGTSPPIIRMVNSLLYHATESRASDIHIEPREKAVLIRERVDGMLVDVLEFPKWVQGAVTSRVKILSRMDISEKRVPQDGRIKIKIEKREVDLRISTLPVHYGEKIVIRILDTGATVLRLEELGLTDRDYSRVKGLLAKPKGIVLVTGPTGSGKSSTLYAAINHIMNEAINIITLEDPIEYDLPAVNQVAVNEKTGLTFAYGLRSILRQDPDVIMVGEMRDLETANIAVQASLTGHLVFSTLHTNTAVASLTRLRNMGVQPYLLASSINGIIAQRLVRRLCNRCKEPYEPSAEDLVNIGFSERDHEDFIPYKGSGCDACNKTGYKGRMVVLETLVCTPRVRELIVDNASEEDILKESLNAGMRYMLEDGIEKVKLGLTSIEELLRVLTVKGEEEGLLCRYCMRSLKHDFLTCPYCGHSVTNKCIHCGRAREAEWSYCPYCREEFTPA